MSSSIFNFDYLRAYSRLPRRTHQWHALLLFSFALVLIIGTRLLQGRGDGSPGTDQSYMSLADERLGVMFVGTSHVGYGIDPKLYSIPAMNITAGALNYECMEIVLSRYLSKAVNLKLLVLEAGIVPLRVDTMSRLDGDYRSLYRLGLDVTDLPLDPYRKFIQWLHESWLLYPIYFMDRWSPSSFVWGTRRLGSEGEGRIDTRGHTTLDRTISEKNDGRVVVEHHRLDHLSVDHAPVNLPALLRILDMANARGLPVMFIRLPHHHTYVENRPAEWEVQYQSMLEAVRDHIPVEKFHYVDWEQLPEFTDRDFADGDHLNRSGVEKLAKKLDPVIRQFTDR